MAKPITLSVDELLILQELKPRVDAINERELEWERRIKALEERLLAHPGPTDQQVDRRARVGLAIEKLMLHFDPSFKGRTVKYADHGYNVMADDTVVEANLSVVTLLERAAKFAESAGTKQVPRQPPKPLEYPDF